jgi:uncharacterized membrane protein YjjB (DUF3815 family)
LGQQAGLSDNMNKTQLIGGIVLAIGFITHLKFPEHFGGTVAMFLGAFVLWNGWVANYNSDIGFAFFG